MRIPMTERYPYVPFAAFICVGIPVFYVARAYFSELWDMRFGTLLIYGVVVVASILATATTYVLLGRFGTRSSAPPDKSIN